MSPSFWQYHCNIEINITEKRHFAFFYLLWKLDYSFYGQWNKNHLNMAISHLYHRWWPWYNVITEWFCYLVGNRFFVCKLTKKLLNFNSYYYVYFFLFQHIFYFIVNLENFHSAYQTQQNKLTHSSIGRGFLNPTFQLRQAIIISFCMQLSSLSLIPRYTYTLTSVITYPHCFLTAFKSLWCLFVLAGMSDFKKPDLYYSHHNPQHWSFF